MKGVRHHPSIFVLLPSLAGASLNVFPFHDLRTYAHFQGEPTPSLVFRPCLLGFSQLFPVRREGCRLLSPLYELPRIMRSKQRLFLLLNSLLFKSNQTSCVCQGSLYTFPNILCVSTDRDNHTSKSNHYLCGR